MPTSDCYAIGDSSMVPPTNRTLNPHSPEGATHQSHPKPPTPRRCHPPIVPETPTPQNVPPTNRTRNPHSPEGATHQSRPKPSLPSRCHPPIAPETLTPQQVPPTNRARNPHSPEGATHHSPEGATHRCCPESSVSESWVARNRRLKLGGTDWGSEGGWHLLRHRILGPRELGGT